ncbi:hypothetical protein CsSME_00027242 [Camellia sinensis var. sinensis]
MPDLVEENEEDVVIVGSEDSLMKLLLMPYSAFSERLKELDWISKKLWWWRRGESLNNVWQTSLFTQELSGQPFCNSKPIKSLTTK